MAIRILVTGGTFDKEHDPITESLVFRDTHIHDMLERSRTLLDIEISTLMLIDSLDITDEDQKNILKTCLECIEDQIIITHGTSNMEKTARFLGENISDKTILLTGAMVPFVFLNSDAMFNMGTAFAYVQTLPKGVYIAMNGKYFSYDNVTKNVSRGIFENSK
jgi:L-asparaginase